MTFAQADGTISMIKASTQSGMEFGVLPQHAFSNLRSAITKWITPPTLLCPNSGIESPPPNVQF